MVELHAVNLAKMFYFDKWDVDNFCCFFVKLVKRLSTVEIPIVSKDVCYHNFKWKYGILQGEKNN